MVRDGWGSRYAASHVRDVRRCRPGRWCAPSPACVFRPGRGCIRNGILPQRKEPSPAARGTMLRIARSASASPASGRGGSLPLPNKNDPARGHLAGSLEVLGGLTKPYVSFIGTKFFRLMLCFVSIVSSAVTLPCPGMGPEIGSYPIEIIGFRPRSDRRRNP
jgi:hypothetical protein